MHLRPQLRILSLSQPGAENAEKSVLKLFILSHFLSLGQLGACSKPVLELAIPGHFLGLGLGQPAAENVQNQYRN